MKEYGYNENSIEEEISLEKIGLDIVDNKKSL